MLVTGTHYLGFSVDVRNQNESSCLHSKHVPTEPSPQLLFKKCLLHLIYLYGDVHAYTRLHVWCGILSFHHVGSGDQTQDLGLTIDTFTPELPYSPLGVCESGSHVPQDVLKFTMHPRITSDLPASTSWDNRCVPLRHPHDKVFKRRGHVTRQPHPLEYTAQENLSTPKTHKPLFTVATTRSETRAGAMAQRVKGS